MAFRPIAYGMYTCGCSLGMPYTPTMQRLSKHNHTSAILESSGVIVRIFDFDG